MADELSALTLLGESADWLKDADGKSIRERRMAVIDAYQTAWGNPADGDRQAALQQVIDSLFDALRHNHLYPDTAILNKISGKSVRYLPTVAALRKEFEMLRNFCVVNKFGIGEVHLLYLVLQICRTLYEPARMPFDPTLAGAVEDVIFLRVPIYRADNLGAFSVELKARYHAVRIMHGMQKLGLFDSTRIETMNPQDQAEMHELLAVDLCATAGRYVQKPHRLAFQVLDAATALEQYARAHAAGRMPVDERSSEELFMRLRHYLKALPNRTEIEPVRRGRLLNLGIAAMARAMAHVEPTLGRAIYSFLRNRKYKPTVRHSRMFELLPNNSERLRFLNFLYAQSRQNPASYITRFQRFFPGEKLRFVSKDAGFAFEGPTDAPQTASKGESG